MHVDHFIKRVRTSKLEGFFHFTDERNIESIRRDGLLSWAEIRRRGMDNVPGGNHISHQLDARLGLDEYVHLCLCNDHGMAHRAEEEGRIGKVRWIRVDPAVAALDGVLMTNDNSVKNGVEAGPIAGILPTLDLDTLYDFCDWQDKAIQLRRNVAQGYELLVPHRITVDYLTL